MVDDRGTRRRRGAVGELVVRGPGLMQGYLDGLEATERAFRDGWMCTGDLGFVDDDGLLHLVGRKKDLIVRGGEHIYPHEVEEVLRRHPAIAEVGVIGVPDRARGEEVAAFVVLADGHHLDSADLSSYCTKHLANFKCPRVIEFRDALPKTPTGGVRKALLAQEAMPPAPGPDTFPARHPPGPTPSPPDTFARHLSCPTPFLPDTFPARHLPARHPALGVKPRVRSRLRKEKASSELHNVVFMVS